MYNAGPRTPLEIFNATFAAGALNITVSNAGKERAMKVIQDSYDQFMDKHPNAQAGYELYQFIEGSLNSNNLLTSSFVPNYPPTPTFTPVQPVQPPSVQPVQPMPLPIPRQDIDPFLTAMNSAPLDSYKIYNMLSKKSLLTAEGKKMQKEVTSIIQSSIQESQGKRLKQLSPDTVKQLQQKLKGKGFLK